MPASLRGEEQSRMMVATTLVARLSFITIQAVALVARLAFISQLARGNARSDPLFEFFNLQTYHLFLIFHNFHLLLLLIEEKQWNAN